MRAVCCCDSFNFPANFLAKEYRLCWSTGPREDWRDSLQGKTTIIQGMWFGPNNEYSPKVYAMGLKPIDSYPNPFEYLETFINKLHDWP